MPLTAPQARCIFLLEFLNFLPFLHRLRADLHPREVLEVVQHGGLAAARDALHGDGQGTRHGRCLLRRAQNVHLSSALLVLFLLR